MVDWNIYRKEIIDYSNQGYSSVDIVEKLKQTHGDIFPRSAERSIRKITTNSEKEQTSASGVKNNAKILIFDIETAPAEAYIWSKFQDVVPDNMIKHDWFVLCWSAKFLFGEEVYNSKLTKKELRNRDDKRIMKNLWHLIDESTVIIAHNAKRFDEKKMNTRYLKHGYSKPSPYQVIDTLVHARKQFAITSNKLDYLAQFFGVEGKHETPDGMWADCMQGDYNSLITMQSYCDQDVFVLEDVYLNMRGWIHPHPNIALQAVSENGCCPVCTSEESEECKTYYRTYVNEYDAFRCKNCGHIYRSRTSNTPLKDNKKLKVSTPK